MSMSSRSLSYWELAYWRLSKHMKQPQDIKFIEWLLLWHQQSWIPSESIKDLAWMKFSLSMQRYNTIVSEYTKALIVWVLEDENSSVVAKKNAKLIYREYYNLLKLWKEFLWEIESSNFECSEAWKEAFIKNDFNIVLPSFKRLIDLRRQQIQKLWYKKSGHPYDALLKSFEYWCTVEQIEQMISSIRENLKDEILLAIAKPIQEVVKLHQDISIDKQKDFIKKLFKRFGVDFNKISFSELKWGLCVPIGLNDVRVSIKYDINNIFMAIGIALHEILWHANYFLWLNKADYWLPSWDWIWYWIHESLARFFQNFIWNNSNFLLFVLEELKKEFPNEFDSFDESCLSNYINSQFSHIRVRTDELTYHIHILIRYELEKMLMEWSIEVEDLPALWNAKYKEYLWIEIDSDKNWILQDMHWFSWWIWYFPTYSLWTFFAAQFYYTIRKQFPDFDERLSKWDFMFLHEWFKENIYVHWKLYNAQELCEKITWEKLDIKYFIKYIKEKNNL